MSAKNNYLDETVSGLHKLFTDEPIDDIELESIKSYLTGYTTLADMTDEGKELIMESTAENIRENIREAFIKTVYHSYRIRYGITQ